MDPIHPRRWLDRCLIVLVAVALGGSVLVGAGQRAVRESDLEALRVEAHLERALAQLFEPMPEGIAPATRNARDTNRRILSRYVRAHEYPHNHDFVDARVPYFVDERGTPCAMAHLIGRSGRADIVDAVVRTFNNASVFEIAAHPKLGPALMAWLAEAGLSLWEAQMIQPSYGGGCIGCIPPDDRETIAKVSWIALGTANGALTLLNNETMGPSPTPDWLATVGAVTGGLGVALGMINLRQNGGNSELAAVNVAVGGLSLLTSGFAFARNAERKAEQEQSSIEGIRWEPVASIDPELRPVAGIRARF